MTKKPKKMDKAKKNAIPSRTAVNKEAAQHWLIRPATIRKLWIGGGVLLAFLVAIELWVQPQGYFGIDDTFAFNAWYGFIVCVAMVVGAKGLGVFLKREDTYYERN